MELAPLITYITRFIELNTHEVAILSDHIKVRTYLKGQYIVQQGDVCEYESFILSGSTKTFFIDQEGHEHVVMLAIENWWTSDLGSFITREPADYHVQCLEKPTVVQFSFDALTRLYEEVHQLERFFRIIIQNAYVESQILIVRKLSLPAK